MFTRQYKWFILHWNVILTMSWPFIILSKFFCIKFLTFFLDCFFFFFVQSCVHCTYNVKGERELHFFAQQNWNTKADVIFTNQNQCSQWTLLGSFKMSELDFKEIYKLFEKLSVILGGNDDGSEYCVLLFFLWFENDFHSIIQKQKKNCVVECSMNALFTWKCKHVMLFFRWLIN